MSTLPNTPLTTIPLNRLVHSKSNARRTGRASSIETLMASIAAHGLRQNLNVRATTGNRFEVIAGGRRLLALRQLMKEGKIDKHTPVPCLLLAEDENATELSLVENMAREAMHPDDECTAFQDLVRQGLSDADIAGRFGVSPALVRQRLKLAGVSPALRRRFRKGELDLSQMMAFALVDDHAAQERVIENLPDWNRDARSIRRALTEEGLPATHRMARYIGLDAYEDAGGVVLRDLFDGEQPPVLADAALVEQLAMRKLEEEAAHIQSEGWKWVTIQLRPEYGTSFGRVYPVSEAEDGTPIYAAEGKARAGVTLTLDYDGTLSIDRGLIDAQTMQAERKAKVKEAPTGGITLPDALVRDMTAQRTAAIRLELSERPLLAMKTLLHAMALSLVYEDYQQRSCLDLRATSEDLTRTIRQTSDCPALATLEDRLTRATVEFPEDPQYLWEWCEALEQDAVMELLALLTALTLNATSGNGDRSPRTSHANQLAAAVELDMAKHWTPEPETFFERLTKSQMQAYLRDAGEHDQAALVAQCKKPEAARRTGKALMANGWLPEPFLTTPIIADDDDHHDVADVGDDGVGPQ
ncbi:ParB/RepB/Spo0J family partition protein [Devosia sp. CAU 1758]